MVKQATTTAARHLRMRAVWSQKDHPTMSFKRIATEFGCTQLFVRRWVRRYEQSSNVDDCPRPGKPPIPDEAAQQHVLGASQLLECKTAADIAAKTKQDLGKHLSCRSTLGHNGLTHKSPKVIPSLTAKQKLNRIKFAKAALRREAVQVSWRRVMVSDSEYFLLQAKGRPAGRWCTVKARGSVARVKHSIGVHVCMVSHSGEALGSSL